MKLYETLDAIVELYNNIYLTQTEYCNQLVYVPAVVRTLLNFFYSNGSSCILGYRFIDVWQRRAELHIAYTIHPFMHTYTENKIELSLLKID